VIQMGFSCKNGRPGTTLQYLPTRKKKI
jgi:hypothetical protein